MTTFKKNAICVEVPDSTPYLTTTVVEQARQSAVRHAEFVVANYDSLVNIYRNIMGILRQDLQMSVNPFVALAQSLDAIRGGTATTEDWERWAIGRARLGARRHIPAPYVNMRLNVEDVFRLLLSDGKFISDYNTVFDTPYRAALAHCAKSPLIPEVLRIKNPKRLLVYVDSPDRQDPAAKSLRDQLLALDYRCRAIDTASSPLLVVRSLGRLLDTTAPEKFAGVFMDQASFGAPLMPMSTVDGVLILGYIRKTVMDRIRTSVANGNCAAEVPIYRLKLATGKSENILANYLTTRDAVARAIEDVRVTTIPAHMRTEPLFPEFQ